MAKRSGAESKQQATATDRGGPQLFLLLVIFFASGAAALIYEVLWLKELSRLFGGTAQAAATTLAVFFLGLSCGSRVWGHRAARDEDPLRTYAYLELGIALTAVLYFFLLDLYYWIYAPLYGAVGESPTVFLAVKVVLATGILFLPAFFMGGTLPVMGQFLVRRADELGRRTTLLYAINTIGAASGALLAGFWLPPLFGFWRSYLLAIGLNVVIAIVALRSKLRSRVPIANQREPGVPRPASSNVDGAASLRLLRSLAFLSGFAALGLEVLWTRMYAQVLQNSVYTFTIILTVFLAALAGGAVLANALCRLRVSPFDTLCGLLIAAGVLVALTPLAFDAWTSGLQLVGGGLGWSEYVTAAFGSVAGVLILPGLAIGSLFPFLMRVAEAQRHAPGEIIGRLAAYNTVGAVLGSLAAGFVALPSLGLWRSMWLVAALYLVAALLLSSRGPRLRAFTRILAVAGLVGIGIGAVQPQLPTVGLAARGKERVLQVWEGSHATVAVLESGESLRVKVNNSYTFGGTDPPTLMIHRLQSWIPLAIHPQPKSIFYLGMGTGITSGASLSAPVEQVTVCELLPEVVAASRAHFGPYLNGLFDDPRVRILIEDGRTILLGSTDRYDVIVAELFLPWKAGTGSLYTQEHFAAVRGRLQPGGLFAQWLPAAQLSRREFGIIARTMLEVFPQITVWRGGFSLTSPAVALVGHQRVEPLDPQSFRATLAHIHAEGGAVPEWLLRHPLMCYVGNLTASQQLFAEDGISSDDAPLIEYLSPITERNAWARNAQMLVGSALTEFFDSLMEVTPPAHDPYLGELMALDRRHVEAGLVYQKLGLSLNSGNREAAQTQRAAYERLLRGAPATPEGTGR